MIQICSKYDKIKWDASTRNWIKILSIQCIDRYKICRVLFSDTYRYKCLDWTDIVMPRRPHCLPTQSALMYSQHSVTSLDIYYHECQFTFTILKYLLEAILNKNAISLKSVKPLRRNEVVSIFISWRIYK